MHFRRSFLVFLLLSSFACRQSKNVQAVIHTGMGDIRVRLFDDVPQYRDFFIQLTESGVYDSLLVRRIERDFVVQSGFARDETKYPVLPNEQQHPLLRGALAFNGAQFFIVQGRPQSDATLDAIEKQTGKKIAPDRRALYKQKGGAPQLEGSHTVFGEVTEGLEVVDKIAALPRDADDRPLLEVRMWVEIGRR